MTSRLRFTYVGGPTALLELGRLRLLTDPTFDPAATSYPTPIYVLHKHTGPAIPADAIGRVDVVLLSHDHHFDNLDRSGREFLSRAGMVLTTMAGAERLRGNAVGLAPWQSHDLRSDDGRILRITATPARHGPVDGDRGPVIGFALAYADREDESVYVSGDTVWYDGIVDIARRFDPRVAVLFGGAARVREVGPAHLTMTADEMVMAARAFPHATIVPLHFEGWQHFSESRSQIDRAFRVVELSRRLVWPQPGQPVDLTL